jgi:hypothetical protein
MRDFPGKFAEAMRRELGETCFLPGDDGSPALEERARLRLERLALSRQRNIERIVELAAAETPADLGDEAPGGDWLSLFFNFAQDISGEAAQPVWARLLAAHVANPLAVFKRTLVELRNLDSWELNAFEEYCAFAFALESGWRFVFEESLTRPETWSYQQGNDYTAHFIHIGLLSPELDVLRMKTARGIRVRYFQKLYELADPQPAKGEGEDELAVDRVLGYRRFSPTGQQIAQALRPRTFNGYARNLIEAVKKERGIRFMEVEPQAAA